MNRTLRTAVAAAALTLAFATPAAAAATPPPQGPPPIDASTHTLPAGTTVSTAASETPAGEVLSVCNDGSSRPIGAECTPVPVNGTTVYVPVEEVAANGTLAHCVLTSTGQLNTEVACTPIVIEGAEETPLPEGTPAPS